MTTPTTTQTVAAFILAQLEADEAAARAATAGPWVAVGAEVNGARHQPVVMGGFDSAGSLADGCTETDAVHIANHDPARVLAQCAAIRAIVEEHVGESKGMPGGLYDPACSVDGYGLVAVDECSTLRHLAAIWRDDPGWREEWSA
jgi:hypothetical protein